jgi:hypothetical protein
MTKKKAVVRRRRRTVKKVEEPVAEVEEVEEEEVEEEEVEVEEAPKPKKTRRRRKSTRKAKPKKAEPVEEAEEAPTMPVAVSKVVDGQFFLDMFAAMEHGQAVTFVRKDDEWIMNAGGTAVVEQALKLRGKEFNKEVQTKEYQEHYAEWKALTDDEKYDVIEEAGVEWEEHDMANINMMRATSAYRTAMEITKYKPQYKTAAARRAIRA